MEKFKAALVSEQLDDDEEYLSNDDTINSLYRESDYLDAESVGAYLKESSDDDFAGDFDDPEIVGAYLGESSDDEIAGDLDDPEIVGAYLGESSDDEIAGDFEDPEIVGAYLGESSDDEFVGAYIDLEPKKIGTRRTVAPNDAELEELRAAADDSDTEEYDFESALSPQGRYDPFASLEQDEQDEEPEPAAQSAQPAASTGAAIDNPTSNFHNIWNVPSNKDKVRNWIGNKRQNTFVMWPNKLDQHLNTPAKVQSFLQAQAFQVPMGQQLRGNTFTSVDGKNKYAISLDESKVNGFASAHHEIAGGSSSPTVLADFPMSEGKIFVRPYQSHK